MSTANLEISDTFDREAPLAGVAGQPAAGSAKRSSSCVYSLPAACRSPAGRAPAGAGGEAVVGWQVREESEYYIPDPAEDEAYDPDPALLDAAEAHTEEQREAMALLDDAENLLDVLLASVEHEGDSRAVQAYTVVRTAKKKLRKAHARIDRQDERHRDLFLAYFHLKTQVGKEAE